MMSDRWVTAAAACAVLLAAAGLACAEEVEAAGTDVVYASPAVVRTYDPEFARNGAYADPRYDAPRPDWRSYHGNRRPRAGRAWSGGSGPYAGRLPYGERSWGRERWRPPAWSWNDGYRRSAPLATPDAYRYRDRHRYGMAPRRYDGFLYDRRDPYHWRPDWRSEWRSSGRSY